MPAFFVLAVEAGAEIDGAPASKKAGVSTVASRGIETGTLWAKDSLPRSPVRAGAAATAIAAETTIKRRRAGPLGREGMGQFSPTRGENTIPPW